MTETITKGQQAKADRYVADAKAKGLDVETETTDYGQISVVVRDALLGYLQIVIGSGLGSGPNPRPRVSAFRSYGLGGSKRILTRDIGLYLQMMSRHG